MRKNLVALLVLTLILVLALPLVISFYHNEEAFSPYNLIRIHIVANSDSPADQGVKLKVKDRIVEMMTPRLAGVKNVSESKRVIAASLEAIKNEAQQELGENGFSYGVKVALGEFQFPTKSYGDLTLPQGEYQALRIVLGEGQGKNWWCVLFPPLCFQEGKNQSLVYQMDKPGFLLKEKLIRSFIHQAEGQPYSAGN